MDSSQVIQKFKFYNDKYTKYINDGVKLNDTTPFNNKYILLFVMPSLFLILFFIFLYIFINNQIIDSNDPIYITFILISCISWIVIIACYSYIFIYILNNTLFNKKIEIFIYSHVNVLYYSHIIPIICIILLLVIFSIISIFASIIFPVIFGLYFLVRICHHIFNFILTNGINSNNNKNGLNTFFDYVWRECFNNLNNNDDIFNYISIVFFIFGIIIFFICISLFVDLLYNGESLIIKNHLKIDINSINIGLYVSLSIIGLFGIINFVFYLKKNNFLKIFNLALNFISYFYCFICLILLLAIFSFFVFSIFIIIILCAIIYDLCNFFYNKIKNKKDDSSDDTTPPEKKEFIDSVKEHAKNFYKTFFNTINVDMKSVNYKIIYIIIAILVILATILYYFSVNSTFLTNNTIIISIFISIIVLIGFFAISFTTQNINIAVIVGALFLGFILLVYFIQNNAASFSNFSLNYLFYIMIILIFLIGLSMFYGLVKNFLIRQRGLVGFIINLIFFIPCMFYDFIEFLKNEYKITSSNIFILFIIELILVICYLYLPQIMSYTVVANNSNLLLDEPRYLNHRIIKTNSDIFLLSESDSEEPNLFRNNNYSFSFWVFVNPTKRESKNIFSFSSSTNNGGKPQIKYGNDETYTDKYIIYYSNTESESSFIEMTLKNQKWNFWTINYLDNVCEIYINGYLEKVININNIPEAGNDTDQVFIGDNDGLDGAICNVNYHNKPLSSLEIVSLYKKDELSLLSVGYPYSSFSTKQALDVLGIRY